MIGEVIDNRYEVLEKIGDGALFAVYKCKDKVLNRLVALKVLNDDFAARPDFAGKVVDYCKRNTKLSYPGIARVLECESTGVATTIACEYVRGVSVRERIRRESVFSVSGAIEVMLKVLESLEYAHSVGVLHGDLRPQDIIVSPDGEVKITDFGVAEALRECPDIAERLSLRSINYQAPEVTEGAVFSPGSDIYSFGAVFYEMLTGRSAFDGVSTLAIALKKVKESPAPVRQLNSEVPKSLNDLVMRCLHIESRERHSNIAALRAELTAIRDGLFQTGKGRLSRPDRELGSALPESAQTTGSRWKEVGLMTLLFVGVVLIMMFAVFFFFGGSKRIAAPQMLGLNWEEASEAAKKAGLVLVDDGRGHSDKYEAGIICDQTPAPGEYVKPGKPEVKVKISEGASWAVVPDLTNLGEADARESAIKSAFNIGKVTEDFSSNVAPNSVIRQDPEPGVQRSPNSSIDIVLSKGVKPPVSSPTATNEATSESGAGKEQTFSIEVQVPDSGDTPKSVKIVVKDDSGENTVVDDMQPAGSYNYDVTTYGLKPTIQVYVDGELKKSERY